MALKYYSFPGILGKLSTSHKKVCVIFPRNMIMAPTRGWRTTNKDEKMCSALLRCTRFCPAWVSQEKGEALHPYSTKNKWLFHYHDWIVQTLIKSHFEDGWKVCLKHAHQGKRNTSLFLDNRCRTSVVFQNNHYLP